MLASESLKTETQQLDVILAQRNDMLGQLELTGQQAEQRAEEVAQLTGKLEELQQQLANLDTTLTASKQKEDQLVAHLKARDEKVREAREFFAQAKKAALGRKATNRQGQICVLV
jgi:chromosome segregation ATPase